MGRGVTDPDGRIQQLNTDPLVPGEYRLALVTRGYFQEHHDAVFYPMIACSSCSPATGSTITSRC